MSEDTIDQRRRRLLQGVAASGISVTLAGCSSGGQGTGTETSEETDTSTPTQESFEPQGPGDREWITGTTSGAQSLNPVNISDEATTNRLNLLYDPGSVTIEGLEFEGRMLSDYQISDDSTTVTYTIREGLQWGADYGEVTADDYIEFLNTIVYGDRGKESRPVGYTQTDSYLLGGERIQVEKLGKREFRATLPQSRGFWLVEDPLRTAYILPADLIKKYKPVKKRKVNGKKANVITQIGQDPAVKEATLSGNLGPFNFESWKKGQKLVVSKNEDYYLTGTELDGLGPAGPNIEKFTYQVFDEQSTAYSALKAGDITATGVESRKIEEIDGTDSAKVWESKFGTGVFYLNLNHRVNGWAPIRESRQVRQAFAHVIDKNTLIEQIFQGHANPASTFHPNWGPFYPDQIQTFEPSIEKAKQKFENGTGSDYTYDGDTFIGPNGEQVELTLVINNTRKSGKIQGNYIKQRLGEAGIAVNIEGTNFTKQLTQYLQNSVENNPNYSGEPSYNSGPYNAGAYDEAIGKNQWDILQGVGFSAAPFSPWQIIDLVLTEQGTFNYIGYTTDDYDFSSAIQEATTAEDPETTREIMADMFQFLAKDQPLTWLFNDNSSIGYRNAVSGLPEADSFWDRPSVRTLNLRSAE
ncbi:ABC transporter substrate-binding protein [Halosegnis sp.]|uniref:ABC transporter substrate-binding protein n=1 Tax=Halosegnis sp. TaxID=2864959 RepID=UPI0035D415E8